MVLGLVLIAAMAVPQSDAIDPKLAQRYFQEAKWISDDDHGALWGKELYGPMIFVDSARTAVASEDPEGMGMTRSGEVFVGKLPATVGMANTAFDWKGRRWTMVMWPLPSNRIERARLMTHELWHRIQADLGLPGKVERNAHLDTMNGRLWLELEIRALKAALEADSEAMKAPEEDALTFRAYRQLLIPGAKAQEDRMEVHEGLAEFTGWALRGTFPPETRRSLAYLRLRMFETNPSLSTSFAYTTGTAYGLCLNVASKDWRKGLTTASSLTDLLAAAIKFQPSSDLKADAESRALRYGGKELETAEIEREKARLVKEAEYRKLVVDGPVLILPIPGGNYSYDPYQVFPLGSDGTVYPETTIIDEWGKIVVTKAARIALDYQHAYVPAPAGPSDRKGDGWTLELKPGWQIVPGPRKGDYRIVRKS